MFGRKNQVHPFLEEVFPDGSRIIHTATLQKLPRNGLRNMTEEFKVLIWHPDLNRIKHLWDALEQVQSVEACLGARYHRASSKVFCPPCLSICANGFNVQAQLFDTIDC